MTRRIWTLKTLPRFLGFGKHSAKLKYAMQPVYANHAVRWTPPPVRKVATTLCAIWLAAVLGLVAVVTIGSIFFN